MTMPASQPPGYQDWLLTLKTRIRAAQTRAVSAVNSELILLYWQMGQDIREQQKQQGWGTKVIDRLATDLQRDFPDMKGFSSRNLKYMRAFAEAWPDIQFVQQVVARLPWGHNLQLLDRLSSIGHRQWYAQAAIANGWSRNVLVHHERRAAAIAFPLISGSTTPNQAKTQNLSSQYQWYRFRRTR